MFPKTKHPIAKRDYQIAFERLSRMTKPLADYTDMKSALIPISRACS